MRNGIVAIRSGLILLFTTAAMAGCGIDGNSVHSSSAGRTDSADLRQESSGMIEHDALTFAADGTLFGRTTPGGLLWEIDINKARAVMSNHNKKLPLDECAITTQLLNDIERSQQP